jgi:hypothetical protein
VTVNVTPVACPSAFDHAWAAAQFAGWPAQQAFEACAYMVASGMSPREVELSFLDARKRIQ